MLEIWDIVLITFPFSDWTSYKIRPVLIRDIVMADVVVFPITSTLGKDGNGFLNIKPTDTNWLKKESTLKYNAPYTIEKSLVIGGIWKISEEIMEFLRMYFCKKYNCLD